jgi:hypothetical protein
LDNAGVARLHHPDPNTLSYAKFRQAVDIVNIADQFAYFPQLTAAQQAQRNEITQCSKLLALY